MFLSLSILLLSFHSLIFSKALSIFLRCESDKQDGFTALIKAAMNGRAECMRLLIDAGANKEARDRVRVGRCFTGMPFCFYFSIP